VILLNLKILVKEPNNFAKINKIDLGQAPIPGYKKYINKELVKLMIKKEGFKPQEYRLNFADQIVIRRDSKQIKSDVIEKHIKDVIEKTLTNMVDKYSVDINLRQNSLTIPDQNYELKILKHRKIKAGQTTIPIGININGEEYKRLYVPVKITAYRKAYVAKIYISQGTKLRRENFAYKLVEVDNFKDEKLIEKDTNLFEKNIELSYSLKQGDVLKKNNYNNPYLINWGDSVEAKVIVGDIELSLMVTVRERGKQGEFIKVENPDNRHQFQAKVISPQLVELRKN
jgi:flagella basal body P-ring formation protein FlgA